MARSFGSVYQKGAKWFARHPEPSGAKTPSGRARYIVRRVRSKAEGRELLDRVRAALLMGTLAPTQSRKPVTGGTLDEAILDYIEACRAAGRKDSTLTQYRYSLRAYREHGIACRPVSSITMRDVEDFLIWRRGHAKGRETASASVLYRDRGLLAAVFHRLIKLGEAEENPAAKVPTPRRPKRGKKVPTRAEVAAILRNMSPHPRDVVLAGLFTGAYPKDLFGLRFRDVDLTREQITVYREKNERAVTIALHPELAKRIREIREERAKKTGRIPGGDFVFLTKHGKPYTNTIKTAFANAVERAGLQGSGFTPKSIRCAFASYFTGTVADLQAILCHAQLATTAHYVQSLEGRARDSIRALDWDLAADGR